MSLTQNHYVIQLPVTPAPIQPLEPREIAQQWITKLEAQLSNNNSSQLSELFHEESWWRDMLALDWDFHTVQNLTGIQQYISRNQPRAGLSAFRLQHKGKFQPKLDNPVEGLKWIYSMFFFETRIGRGSGVLRLTQNETGVWKAYSVYTSLQELKSFEEPLGSRRAEGTIESIPGGVSQRNWLERRQRQVQFTDEEPTTLIVGAGESLFFHLDPVR